MSDLCSSCLCPGRKLYYLDQTAFYHIYLQILNEISVYNISELCLRLCWECCAILRRFQAFKRQAHSSYHSILQHIQQNTVLQAKAPRLATHSQVPISYPDLDDNFSQFDHDIGQSLDHDTGQSLNDGLGQNLHDGMGQSLSHGMGQSLHEDGQSLDMNLHIGDELNEEEHCEPETFVREINVGRRKKKTGKDKAIKDKKKKSKTKKVKLKRSKTLNDDIENYYDDNSPLDYNITDTENTEIKEEINKGNEQDETCSENYKEIEETHAKIEKSHAKIVKTHAEIEKTHAKRGKTRTKVAKSNAKVAKSNANAAKGHAEIKDDNLNVEEKFDVNELKCIECNVTFETKSDLDNHLIDEHETESRDLLPRTKEVLPERPQCGECGKFFSSKKTYRYHLNVLHKGQNRYPCPRCGKVYQWKSNLGRHMRSHKARDSGELFCEQCDKRFASIATYRQHLKISRRHVSESEFSFMCNDCGKKFVNKTRLRDHIDWEHLNNIKFRCQLCDKAFKCHTSLYVHLQNVHRNKEKKDNLCHVCGKSYQNAAKLKYHIVAMHTAKTPYSCSHCSAAFGWYSSLYRHVREVHFKMKVQPKKNKKSKKADIIPNSAIMPPMMPQIPMPLPHPH